MITKGHIMIATVLVALFVTLTFVTSVAAQNSPTSMQQQIDDLNKRVTALEHILHSSPNKGICIGAC